MRFWGFGFWVYGFWGFGLGVTGFGLFEVWAFWGLGFSGFRLVSPFRVSSRGVQSVEPRIVWISIRVSNNARTTEIRGLGFRFRV